MPKFPVSEKEIEAIATFVLGLVADPPAEKYVYRPQGHAKARLDGEKLLAKYNCTGCHMENGEGIAQIFPSLKASSGVQAKLPDTVIHVVLAGAKVAATPGKPTGFAMPAFAGKPDDKEVAELVHYLRNACDNHES